MAQTKRLIGVAAAVAVALGASAPASAESAERGSSAPVDIVGIGDHPALPESPATTDTEKVTLITGDQVWLTRSKNPSGETSVHTRIKPANRPNGRQVAFAQWGTPDEYFVVPSDLLPLLASRVDERLFDVAGLIDSGADSSSPTPVIVTLGGAARGASAVAAAARPLTEAFSGGTVLASANAVALKVPPGKALELFDRAGVASKGAATSQAPFVSWDAPVKAVDATSMRQIGATKAWAAGYTGKGVKVAVLDTGIDATHPDLKGQVAASKNFSNSTVSTDRDGHGTHVASIVAGTGAAGGPGIRGVAFEATLLNGKVLGDDGSGRESEVIRGMEWAAKSGADVINMSLGGAPGNGTDPVEAAVNSLSEQYGTLFAIAAGNGGSSRTGGVTSPSTADAAMSVAAVDSKNQLAPFSDTGPRQGDLALKPDVAAPGVGILGARSKINRWNSGTSPYVRLSGTSMATPHVAGAAAVLAQARPELSGSELKAALMGSATKPRGSVWQEGAGTLNIPGAIGMPVIAEEGSLSYGQFAYPQSDLKPATKTIHYRNTGSVPITLSLAAKVTNAKGYRARGVSLSKSQVTLPPGGRTVVRVTVRPGANAPGRYAGDITATPSKGHAIRTILGWTSDEKLVNVTIKPLAHSGVVGNAYGVMRSLADPRVFQPLDGYGVRTVKVPAGQYFVGGYAYPKGGFINSGEVTLDIKPQLSITADTTITLGGPKGRKVSPVTPKRSAVVASAYSYERRTKGWGYWTSFGVSATDPTDDMWVMPAPKPTTGDASFLEQATLAGPGASPAYAYQLAFLSVGAIPKSGAYRVGPKQLSTTVGTYRSQVADATGTSLWAARARENGYSTELGHEFKLPATMTTFVLANGVQWKPAIEGPNVEGTPSTNYVDGPWRTPRAGVTRRAEYFSPVASPSGRGGIAYRVQDLIQVGLPTFEDGGGQYAVGAGDLNASLEAYVGPNLVWRATSAPWAYGVFPAPPGGGSLRLVQKETRNPDVWRTSTSMTGEWRAPLPTSNNRVLPLMNVQYQLRGQSLSGAVPSGKQTLGLTVSTYPNPKYARTELIAPKSLKLEWSVDGGKTWNRATVSRTGKKATATFTPPAPKGGGATMVSLRATASDGKGSSVKETIVSAYELSDATSAAEPSTP